MAPPDYHSCRDVYSNNIMLYFKINLVYKNGVGCLLLAYHFNTYIDIGVFILGFFMGKIIVKRSIDISFLRCLIYALISFGLMLLIGSLKYVFYDYMYSNFTFTFSIFIESLGDRDSLVVSIGTFISFLIGEIVEYMTIYFKDK